MAVYSTFFLSSPEQLQSGFPGWKLPLAEPVARTSINPFTREEITITSRAPDWDDCDPEALSIPDAQVVAIEGDYESFLERRIPSFVQAQPHWCAKNLTSIDLNPLVAIVTDLDDGDLQTALYAHRSLGTGIECFPSEFIDRLKAADASFLHVIAEKWATEMSTSQHTHSVSGHRVAEDRTVQDALSLVSRIAELTRQQTDGQSMYLLVEA